jgi:hypothetical protein
VLECEKLERSNQENGKLENFVGPAKGGQAAAKGAAENRGA